MIIKNKLMKKTIYLAVILALLIQTSFAQEERVSFNIDGKNVNLSYKEITDSVKYRQFRPKQYPAVVMDLKQFNILTGLLTSNINSLAKFENMAKLYSTQDSLCTQKELYLNEIIEKQEKRVALFRNSYKDIMEINSQLSDQLVNCTKLSREINQSKNKSGLIYGGLGGLAAGLIIGFIIAK